MCRLRQLLYAVRRYSIDIATERDRPARFDGPHRAQL
jgi:hypothetical protein